jgi:rhamnosyltransferase
MVTWNPDLARLEKVVQALIPQVEGLVVVDNGSIDSKSVASLLNRHINNVFIGVSENLGIGAGLNLGIRRALLSNSPWILTMDQDTVLFDEAVDNALRSFSTLESRYRNTCGVLAMRPAPQPSSIWLTQYADRLMVVKELALFVERRAVITSGSLIKADVAKEIAFNELLFIDQVDFDFCFSLRSHGYKVLQLKAIAMDHVLGEAYVDPKRDHPYENAQRFYYIVRNSTYLMLRRRLSLRFYLVQIAVFSGAYISVNGAASTGHAVVVICRGMIDGTLSRLGRREYPFLRKGRY